MMRRGWVVGLALVLAAAPVRAQCPGDCDGDGIVTVADVITVVNIALGVLPASACPGSGSNAGIGEAIAAVQAALEGCPTSPAACPSILIAAGSSGTVLAGPGLLVQANGAFAVATASTVVTGAPSTARGEVTVRRYDSTGALASQTQLASRQQVLRAPALARLPNGGGMAVWGEANPRQFGSPISRLATRRFSNDGRALGGVALAARAVAGQTFNGPSLSADGSGNALFAWMAVTQGSAGGTLFQGQLREQRPSGLRPPQPLNCFGNPVAVSTGSQLGAVCVAFDIEPAQQIALRAFALDQGSAVPLFDFASAASPFSSLAAAASSDRILAAWRQPFESDSSRSRLVAQVVGVDGTPIVGPIEVAVTVQTEAPPAVALLADGSFAVAYDQTPLLLRRFTAGGRALGQPLVIADTLVDALAMEGDSAGNLVVAWRWRDVMARRVPAPGGTCE